MILCAMDFMKVRIKQKLNEEKFMLSILCTIICDICLLSFHTFIGTGFISHHLALTNTFEAALRAVDPSVTLPYWDFTIEGEAVKYVLINLQLSSLKFSFSDCYILVSKLYSRYSNDYLRLKIL